MTGVHALSIVIREHQWFRQDVIVASGYFNPLHLGHIKYLNAAKWMGGKLAVVVNNDHQVALKGATPFMSEQDRAAIVGSLRFVDYVTIAIDKDRGISKTLEILRPTIFVNGGDVRDESECREAETCRKLGIHMVFGVGGNEKLRSSSDLIRRAVSPS